MQPKTKMEYKGIVVREKPKIWEFIPWLSSYTAQAIYPNIYVSKAVYEDLGKKNPNPKFVAVLEHEKKHIERQKELGFIKFGIGYLFFPKFRFQEELSAIREGTKYLKKNKLTFNTERSAKYLSSWLYLWMVSYDKAKKELDRIWHEID